MTTDSKFHEIQYLGYNLYGFIRRSFVMTFCFLYYLLGSDGTGTGEVFFYLGIVVLSFSAAAFFIPHMQTDIRENTLTLKGLASFRKVEFNLTGIKNIEVGPYSPYRLNRPIFNLHKMGERYFYAYGRMCVRFELPGGERVHLGSQRPEELCETLKAVSA